MAAGRTGPPGVIIHGMATTLSSALADISLPDTQGRSVRLGDLWERSPTILVFLRHYG